MSNTKKGFRPDAPETPQPTYNALACNAWGCPLLGSMDLGGGGKYFCHCHVNASPKEWQNITGLIRSHQWLIDFTASMRAMKRTSDWRGMAARFWAQAEPEVMVPHQGETLDGYVYRLHLELAFRVGVRSTRPRPTIPAGYGQPKRRVPGSLGDSLPDRAEAVAA